MSAELDETEHVVYVEPQIPLRLRLCIWLSLFSMCFTGETHRIVPGGPFISVTGDLIPFVVALIVICLGFSCLRWENNAVKLLAIVFMHVAAVAAGTIFSQVYSFWIRPYSSGVLWGP